MCKIRLLVSIQIEQAKLHSLENKCSNENHDIRDILMSYERLTVGISVCILCKKNCKFVKICKKTNIMMTM